MNKSGATRCIETIIEHGVTTIFGYPGGAIMPIYDALVPHFDTLRHVLMRHEQGATHAAEGYSRTTGKVGVCFATSGPGATNLITGMADALMDSVPMVCITGQVNSKFLGTDAFQETDIISIATPVTKWAYQCTSADEIAWAIKKGFEIATSGRPGPVLIDITKDAQVNFCENEKPFLVPTKKNASSFEDKLQEVASLLNATDEVLLLLGNGIHIANAEEAVKGFIEQGNLPFAATLHGLSVMPKNHPMYVGMLGMHGNYAPNLLTNKAKVIMALGMRFDDRVTGDIQRYAPHAQVIHVEIDPSQFNKAITATIPIEGCVKNVLTKLTPMIERRERKQWREEFQTLHEEEMAAVIIPECERTSGEVSMGEAICAISSLAAKDAIFVADVGQHQMSAARYLATNGTQRFLSSGGLGTMGFAVPAAFGASIAHPQKQVIAIAGDGGFQMTVQELGAIAQEKTPVKIIILNNSFLGMVRQWQELFFDRRYSFVEMKNPDFVALGESYGIPGIRITEREKLMSSLSTILNQPGPALIEICVENEQNIFPMIPAGKAVDEMILRKQ